MEKQVVINIPDEVLQNIQARSVEIQAEGYTLENAVLNGIVLPKEHGDLIDISNIDVVELEDSNNIIHHKKGDEVDVYISAPVIIPASKRGV